jgi:hypothetical protein
MWTISSGICFLQQQEQRRYFSGKLCGKDKFEALILQQLSIFLLIVVAQWGTISSGIAFFKQPEKL